MAVGTAILDFGVGNDSVNVAVADATVAAGTKVEAYLIIPASNAPRYADEYWVEDLQVYAGAVAAGVGFTIWAICRTGKAVGQFIVNYVTF